MGSSKKITPFTPFKDFTGPSRRRTDHPLVIGTIVLCLAFITVATLMQVTGTFWTGSQIKRLLDAKADQDAQTEQMRKSIIRHSENQASVLRRVCLNLARTDGERGECLTVAPPISPSPHP